MQDHISQNRKRRSQDAVMGSSGSEVDGGDVAHDKN